MLFSERTLLRRSLALAACLLAGAVFAAVANAASPEAPFLAENDVAMTKMMAAMTISPTGDIDRDFVAMMAPHHQGAIDMAEAELRYGRNERLRRLAQEIIVTQQQEIAAMHLAIGDPLPPSAPAPDQVPASPTATSPASPASMPAQTMPGMDMSPMQMKKESHP